MDIQTLDIGTLLDIHVHGYKNLEFIQFIQTWTLELFLDVQTLDIGTFTGCTNIGHWNFYWMYKHWTLELLLDVQTLDIGTLLDIYMDIQTLN